jgi:hypothetical protein
MTGEVLGGDAPRLEPRKLPVLQLLAGIVVPVHAGLEEAQVPVSLLLPVTQSIGKRQNGVGLEERDGVGGDLADGAPPTAQRTQGQCRPDEAVNPDEMLTKAYESLTIAAGTTLVGEIRALGPILGHRKAILDGELVAWGDDGRPDFGHLFSRYRRRSPRSPRRADPEGPVTWVAFDVCYLDGISYLDQPYHSSNSDQSPLAQQQPALA